MVSLAVKQGACSLTAGYHTIYSTDRAGHTKCSWMTGAQRRSMRPSVPARESFTTVSV